jgi:DNA-binding NtrC family response regulator
LEHDLFESELFGHSAGAFTGAMRAKEGLLSAASPGTLFLDEIGEMSKRSQAKLLRSIETGELRRLGETKSVKVDVRIVAATNRRLRWLASEGAFRSDLFFRLAAFTIDLPPLRDRKTDIPLLARALLRRGHASASGFGVELSDDAVGALCEYGWPGNVRELQNTVRSAAVRCVNDDSERIEVRHLMLSQFEDFQAGMQGPKVATQDSASELDFKALRLGDAGSYRGLREEIVRNFDRRYFTQLLTETGGNVSKAARLAGLDRKRLREKLGTVGLAADDFRS